MIIARPPHPIMNTNDDLVCLKTKAKNDVLFISDILLCCICIRENPSAVKDCDKPKRPNCSRNMDEDNENTNPNFTVTNLVGGTNKLKKPLLRSKSNTKRDNLKELNDLKECPVRSNRRSKLKSTFSAQNLLGGREILSQITGFCSELKRLATRKGSTKKGVGNEKGSNSNGVLEELKEKSKGRKERIPLLVVKEGTHLE